MQPDRLAGWDWQHGFAELRARFGPAPARTLLEPGDALAAAVRYFKLDRFFQIRATQMIPVTCLAPHLELAGNAPAWVVLVLGTHRRGGSRYPGDDPLGALGGSPAVVQALVGDRSGAVAAGVVVPVRVEPGTGPPPH